MSALRKVRTVEHEGHTLLVLSVDMSTADTVVQVSPLMSFKYDNKRVVHQWTYSAKKIRLVNVKMLEQDLTFALAAKMLEASRAERELAAKIKAQLNAEFDRKLRERLGPKLVAMIERGF